MNNDTSLSLFKLDDFHLHLRDGAVLTHTATTAAQYTHYATIMPNTQPPITNTQAAIDYRQRILTAINNNNNNNKHTTFTPLMTLYLTNDTTPEEIHTAKESGVIYACKLYPAGATTHSQQGVSMHDDAALRRLHDTFEAMAECGLLLLIHGEVTDQQVDIFDREHQFLIRYLPGLLSAHPTLRIVFEHITTAEAVSFVQSCTSPNLGATITAHHLLYNRNALFTGGLNPHNYCLPVLKAEHHRLALLAAATSHSDKFFAGTDSAPHSAQRKRDEGCAGCYTAFTALELYATAFQSVGKLDVLQAFCCERGRAFYRLPQQDDRHRQRVQLVRSEWTIPEKLPFGNEYVVPFMAGKTLRWKAKQQDSENQ